MKIIWIQIRILDFLKDFSTLGDRALLGVQAYNFRKSQTTKGIKNYGKLPQPSLSNGVMGSGFLDFSGSDEQKLHFG